MHRKPLLIGVVSIELAEDGEGFGVPCGVLVGFPEVVAQFAYCICHRAVLVFVRPFDVAQSDQLLQRLPGCFRIEAGVRRVPAIGTGNFIPTGDGLGVGRSLECIAEHLAVHIRGRREAEEGEDCGGDIEHAYAMQQFIAPDAWSADGEDSELAVFRRRWSGWKP